MKTFKTKLINEKVEFIFIKKTTKSASDFRALLELISCFTGQT